MLVGGCTLALFSLSMLHIIGLLVMLVPSECLLMWQTIGLSVVALWGFYVAYLWCQLTRITCAKPPTAPRCNSPISTTTSLGTIALLAMPVPSKCLSVVAIWGFLVFECCISCVPVDVVGSRLQHCYSPNSQCGGWGVAAEVALANTYTSNFTTGTAQKRCACNA